jgi:hypothetical protein
MKKTGLKRVITDKFYTNENVVIRCIDLFSKHITVNDNDLVIEPSAGNGSFTNKLNYKNVLSYDVEPENEKIIKQNFLLLEHTQFSKYDKVHIIGNPPFGRQSSLCKKFIKKSCLFAQSISFILPKSFKKISFQKTFENHFHLIEECDLPENSFSIDKKSYNVPCVFQIWIKMENLRKEKVIIEPTYFEYVKKTNDPTFSIRRVGVNAGMIDVNYKNKSIQSHYFIKLKNVSISEFIKKYRNVIFEFNNSVGPKSISKQELNEKLISLF